MIYLLDTNAVIALLTDRYPGVQAHMQRAVAAGSTIAVSTIVLFELWYGIARSERRRENAEGLRLFLARNIVVLPFEAEDARAAGDLRAALVSAGTPIGPYDMLIAGQALRTGVTLVTANVAEFARVHGLAWEDWSASE